MVPRPVRLPEVGLGMAIAVLLGISVLSHTQIRKQAETATWVAHTHEVIQVLELVPAGIARAESNLRGYGLTGDGRFLAGFPPALRSTRDAMASLHELTGDNVAQRTALARLGPLVARRVEQLDATRERLLGGDKQIVHPEAQALSQEIEDGVGGMIETERRLLAARAAEDRIYQSRTLATSSVGVVFAVALVGVALVLVSRERHRRELAEHQREVTEAARVRELTLLLETGELLQACRTPEEAFEVISHGAPKFFGGESGAVYLFDASRTSVEARAAWGDFSGAEAFSPDDCWALRRGQPHVVRDVESGLPCKHVGSDKARSTACLPLLAQGELLGTLHLTSKRPIDGDVRRRAAVLSEQIRLALANLQLRETLRNQSIRDPLTGLFNRRYTEETLVREIQRARRERGSVSVLMLDIDHFKRFNDTFGHDAGDRVLVEVGRLLKAMTRGSDIPSRLGGEELLVALPGAALPDALVKAETLRAAVAALPVEHHGRALGTITVSTGVAAWPIHGDTWEEVLRRADAALYRAKRAGRNRVESAGGQEGAEEVASAESAVQRGGRPVAELAAEPSR